MKHINYDQKLINKSTMTQSFPITIIVSRFNQDITQALKEGALQHLKQSGFTDDHITLIEVPGAIEIPITAQTVAQNQKPEAIITLGAVIRGETSHYDYVCEQVSQGCQAISLKYNLPIIFGILTTENEAQAWDRLGGAHGHKGIEAAQCAIEMRAVLQEIVLTK